MSAPDVGSAPVTVVLDVDGTLVDTNYQHAIAWHRAFKEHGYRVAIWEIHRHIGMGGDQLIGRRRAHQAAPRTGPGRARQVRLRRRGADGRRLDPGRAFALSRDCYG